ncbi:hypothetical protein [Arachnia propionica]|uniref:hypothetical protein n=1 Tax=Arachnia propionica TaxID=1750 RepID=UPI001C897FDA|nr:hypothetical protein [Arachnia propionica]MDO5083856.1 hypothetical protein [Arachnia propionica]
MRRNRVVLVSAALLVATGMAACTTGNQSGAGNSGDGTGSGGGRPTITFIQG